MSVLTNTDYYKLSHEKFMNKGTTMIYSNLTARSAKWAPVLEGFDNKTVFFGLQKWMMEYLIDEWERDFFDQPKEGVIKKFKRRVDTSLGPNAVDMEHFETLHSLGYLPIEIKAVEEGTRVDIGVPMLTIKNTLPEYAWVTNYLETVMSCDLWKPITTATIAYEYRRLMEKWANATGCTHDHIGVQCHDFSFRGMSGRHDAAACGAGHLLSFVGTDTIPAIDLLEDYYGADAEEELIGCSVPASEHSVTSLGTSVEGEFETIKRWITEDYPKGIVSVVSDTYDFWKVLTDYLPRLKEDILNREEDALGLCKTVIRPDSGDPADIICGTGGDTPEGKGAIELLWETFGGTYNEAGYKVLNPKVGLIYGDSITLERADDILSRLEKKGFAASNVVFGVGSFTYQYLTRDTFGMAVKATAAVVDGVTLELFKDPVTDDGTKKSAKGWLRVYEDYDQGDLHLEDQCENDEGGVLQVVFQDGKIMKYTDLSAIRSTLLK